MRIVHALCWLGLLIAYPFLSAQAQQENHQPEVATQLHLWSIPITDQMTAAFSPYHLVPIVVPRGEGVGFIYSEAGSLLATQKDCFPGLQTVVAPGQLPTFEGEMQGDLAAALGVVQIGDISAGMNSSSKVELSFRNVEATMASVFDLSVRPVTSGVI